jgi:hypothetical protein
MIDPGPEGPGEPPQAKPLNEKQAATGESPGRRDGHQHNTIDSGREQQYAAQHDLQCSEHQAADGPPSANCRSAAKPPKTRSSPVRTAETPSNPINRSASTRSSSRSRNSTRTAPTTAAMPAARASPVLRRGRHAEDD